MKKLLLFLLFPAFLSAQEQALTPNYPKLSSTGNAQLDEEQRIKAKNEWIKNHPEEYRSVGGNPEQVLKELAAKEAQQKVTTDSKGQVIFQMTKAYQLVGLEVVPVGDAKPSESDKTAALEDLKKDYHINKTQLQIGSGNMVRLYEPDHLDLKAIEHQHGNNLLEWVFERKDCPACTKTLLLNIEKQTASEYVLLMKGEDSSDVFAYRFIYSLISPKTE